MAAERKRTISAWIKTKMRRMGIRIDKLRGDKVFPPNQLPQANMVFPLKELPQELRIMIYTHELYHVPGATRPALLRVLHHAKDEELVGDYDEAVKFWEYGGGRMHNFQVTSTNIKAFKKLHRDKMLKIRHLTVVVDTQRKDGEDYVYSMLKSNKCKLMNSFESLMIDVVGPEYWDNALVHWARHVVAASFRPYRVIFRIPEEFATDSELAKELRPMQCISSPYRVDRAGNCLLIIWENGDKMLQVPCKTLNCAH